MKIAEALIKYADAAIKGDERAARAARRELEEALPLPLREVLYKYSVKAALTDDSRLLLARLLKAVVQPGVVDEKYRIALEAVLAGMALRPKLLVDLLEGRRGGREIIVEALEALSREVERAGGGVMPMREQVVEAAEAGQIDKKFSVMARHIIEAAPPSLRHLLHGLVEELRAGKTPREAVEALRPRLAELARDAAEAFRSAEDVEYLAKSFGVKPHASEEKILEAFEKSFLRAAERLARLPENQRRDVLEYIEKRLGRLLKVVGIAAIGVTLAVLANDPSWLRRSAEAAVAIAGAHAALPVAIFAFGLAKRAGEEEAAEAAKSITVAVIKAEVWRRAEKEKWRRFMAVEKAKFVVKGPNVGELVLNGAKIGEIVGERIEGDPRVDTKLKIELPGLRVELELNEGKLREAVEEWKKLQKIMQRVNSPEELERLKEELESATKELERLGEDLGDMAFGTAAVRYSKEGRAKVVEDAFMLASALEKQMRAMFGENAEKIVEEIWREVYRLDKVLSDRALEALREEEWKLHAIEESARIVAEHLPQYKEYIERLEGIADLLKAAARELVEEAEREGRGGIVKIMGRPYFAYEGPVELSARVEHMEEGKYTVIEVKYGDRAARVELDIKKYRRSALLHNLTAIATDDARVFYEGYVLHNTTSPVQAAERLLMWALFMPGEYVLKVRRARATEDGLSPEIEISSRFGWGGLAKIERESSIHRLVLKLARELAGVENLREAENATDKILAAAWLLASAILNTPDGKKPSDGIEQMAKRMAEATARRIAWEMAAREGKEEADDEVMERARRIVEEQGLEEKYRKALERLRPLLEELDKDEKDGGLGTVSRVDKALLVGKLVDYDGTIDDGLLLIKADTIKRIMIELGGVEIRMLDVAEAAAKAFSEKGGWRIWIDEEGKLHIGRLSLGPAEDVPELESVPTFKATAALIAREMRKEADELRQKDLIEHGEPIKHKIGDAEVKITPAEAKEGEQTPIVRENLKEVWKGFEDRKYTHLRLVVGGEEYELLSKVRSGSAGRVAVRFEIRGKKARELAERLKGLGLEDVKVTPSGFLYLYREHLEALLDKGVKAYAVRRAKKGEAQWHLEITYRGKTMALKMSYNERDNRLIKFSSTGKIEAIVYEEGATKGEQVKLDLMLVAAIGEGREDCDKCLEKWLVEALNAAASKNPGFKWSVVSKRGKHLIIKPPNLRDNARRFYSNI